MGRVEGKVALITGAARGQGRSHAECLAREGADIIAVDSCAPIATAPYEMPTPEDLDATVKAVEALGRRAIGARVDVRDYAALQAAVDDGVGELGRLDIVSANAGIGSFTGKAEELTLQTWHDMIDINLSGVYHTARVAIPHIKRGGEGGSIILTSSTAGLRAMENAAHYVSAKHGVVGLMKALALELGPFSIRCNSVHPTGVATEMVLNPAVYKLFAPEVDVPTREHASPRFAALNVLPVDWVDSVDISNAVVWLASEEARYVTGVALSVDAGAGVK